jgi:folate-binding protein YgfZ
VSLSVRCFSAPWIVLSDAIAIRVSGKDARRYLHNRLSQDIRALKPNHSARAAALSAQGRVEGVFTVFCESEDSFLLVCDGGDPVLVLPAIKRFVVADRVVCKDISAEVSLVHIAAQDEVIECFLNQSNLPIVFRTVRGRMDVVGSDVLIDAGDRQALAEKIEVHVGASVSVEDYDYLRWKAGYPVFPDEINEQGMALEFGLREEIVFNKGCYVGQEVVERSDAIGRVPRSLARIILNSGPGEVAHGTSIANTLAAPIGKVLRAVYRSGDDSVYLFALLSSGKYKVGDVVICAGREGRVV